MVENASIPIPADSEKGPFYRFSSPDLPLSPELEALVDQQVQAVSDWTIANKEVHDRAAKGQFIFPQDFSAPEEQFNQEFNDAQEAMHKQIEKESKKAGGGGRVVENRVAALNDRCLYAYQAKLYKWKVANPDIVAAAEDTKPLDAAFQRGYVASAFFQKDVALQDVKDQADLITQILAKNRGVAIGDFHTYTRSEDFIANNIQTFKAAGVDTLYLEYPPSVFKEVEALSLPELKILADKGKYKDIKLPTVEDIARKFDTEHSEDNARGGIRMMLAARENGIRVINIDKDDPIREHEPVDHRISSVNFEWTDAIQKDRIALFNKGKTDGKFIVFAGMGHFLRNKSNGMVDEALGIPVIVFEKSSNNPTIVARPGDTLNAPDVYLPGGPNYYDTAKKVKAADCESASDLLSIANNIPPVKMLQEKLEAAAEQYRKEAWEEVQQQPASLALPAQWPKPHIADNAPEHIPAEHSGQLPSQPAPAQRGPSNRQGKS